MLRGSSMLSTPTFKATGELVRERLLEERVPQILRAGRGHNRGQAEREKFAKRRTLGDPYAETNIRLDRGEGTATTERR